MRKSNYTPGASGLRRIEELARDVAEPKFYMKGRIAHQSALPGNILCFIRRRAEELNRGDIEAHDQHHRFVFIAAIRGTGRMCIDSRNFLLREGEARLVFPFQFHSYHSLSTQDICWVFITFELEEGEMEWERLRSSRSRLLGDSELALLATGGASAPAGHAKRCGQREKFCKPGLSGG